MTDEQIKQNAEKEASKAIPREASLLTHEAIKTAYIQGAHSRDEEIEELKKKLDDMTRLKNLFASSLDIYDRDNKQLQDELAELRNKKVEYAKKIEK